MRAYESTGQTRQRHRDAPDTAGAFARLAELPDGAERAGLRAEVIQAWMPMAERLAGRFRNRGESAEDLRQVAALGLVKAVDRFDPARGTAFESFAVPTVVGEVKRHFRDHLWGLHVPRRVQELRNRIRGACQELLQELDGRGPTVAEVARHTGLTEEDVLLGLDAQDSFNTMSLEAELPGTDGYTLADTLGNADPGLDLVVHREAVKPLLRDLAERERRILYLRFFGDMTQNQIASIMGISQMHVSRLISRTCAELRAELLAEA